MAGLWLVYTSLHGPTSYQEDREFLGGGVHLWGMLLGAVPNTLIGAGLFALRGRLAGAGRLAAIGHGLTCGALVLAAVLDVAVQAINAPFLLPVQAVGVLLLTTGLRGRPEPVPLRTSFGALGCLLATSMAVAFIPQEVSDPIGGFRIFGAFAYLLPGLAWAVIGSVLSRRRPHGS